jgi:hypothetical protein
MAHASQPPADCEILGKHPQLSFRNGPYTYQITRQTDRILYTISDNVNKVSEPVLFCFGEGKVGQTYTFTHDGSLYESRVSFFNEIQNLDFTTGHSHSVPTSLEDALGRRLSRDEAQSCYSCHMTTTSAISSLQSDRLIHGVTCEACHGPGEKHLAAVKARDLKNLAIFNPASLNSNELTQSFCGACHLGFEQTMLLPAQGGLNNIRFQAYRIFNSKGHNSNDPRISCTACHNPHAKLERDSAFYDSKCMACHTPNLKAVKADTHSAAVCPVSNKLCVTCHMQKVELPSMHAKFTDHWIRIVKPGGSVPH